MVTARQREPEGKNPLGCGPGLLVGTRAAQLWARPYCLSLEGAGSTGTRGHRGREVAPPAALVTLAWWQRQSPPVTSSCTSTRRPGLWLSVITGPVCSAEAEDVPSVSCLLLLCTLSFARHEFCILLRSHSPRFSFPVDGILCPARKVLAKVKVTVTFSRVSFWKLCA